MTEAVKDDAGANKTQTESQGAQSGEPTLEQLLAEGRKGMSQTDAAAETKDGSKTTTTQAETTTVSEADVAARVEARMNAKAEFKALAEGLAKDTGLPEEDAVAMLTGDLTTNAGLQKAWLTRGSDPAHWAKVATAYRAKKKETLGGIVAKAKEQTSDRAAVRAAARVSPSATDEPKKPVDLRRDHRARMNRFRELGIR